LGAHAAGGNAADPVAREFFDPWAMRLTTRIHLLNIIVAAVLLPPAILLPLWLQRRAHKPESASDGAGDGLRNGPRTAGLTGGTKAVLVLAGVLGVFFTMLVAGIALWGVFGRTHRVQTKNQRTAEFYWEELPSEVERLGGEIVELDGRMVLKIENRRTLLSKCRCSGSKSPTSSP
jgi:hypothetical protein